MAEQGLVGQRPRAFRRTTDSRHGKPVAPAVISKSLGIPGPRVRTALGRMKDDPDVPVINLGHGAWIHAHHADDYQTAA